MFVDDEASPAATIELDEAEPPEPQDELMLARELVLKAHPESVPELIAGTSLAELLASVPTAEAAFARVAETARAQASLALPNAPASVPGGGAVRSSGVNVEGLGPLAKIRAGLSQS